MRGVITIILLPLIIVLNGCSTKPNYSANTLAWLTPQVAVRLPMVTVIDEIHHQQLLTSHIKGKQHSLIALLNIKPGVISLIGLSPMGVRLFSVNYNGQQIQVEQHLLLPELPSPNQVLADILLSYAPISEWEKVLPLGWHLIEDTNQRYLFDDQNQLISEITYQITGSSKQPVLLKQQIFSYQISIQNMDNQP